MLPCKTIFGTVLKSLNVNCVLAFNVKTFYALAVIHFKESFRLIGTCTPFIHPSVSLDRLFKIMYLCFTSLGTIIYIYWVK